MKECENCGKRMYRETRSGDYNIAVVDGARYPETCPRCGVEQ